MHPSGLCSAQTTVSPLQMLIYSSEALNAAAELGFIIPRSAVRSRPLPPTFQPINYLESLGSLAKASRSKFCCKLFLPQHSKRANLFEKPKHLGPATAICGVLGSADSQVVLFTENQPEVSTNCAPAAPYLSRRVKDGLQYCAWPKLAMCWVELRAAKFFYDTTVKTLEPCRTDFIPRARIDRPNGTKPRALMRYRQY